ncbi:UNVERIFIED_CONTAM: hypothetical protein K2H54_030118 [Gekko kuhli]
MEELGTESSNSSAMAQEEQDDDDGGAEERRGCQAVPHPRPKNEEGPRDAEASPAGDTEEWCNGERHAHPQGPQHHGMAGGHGLSVVPFEGGGAGGQNGSRGVEGVIKGRSWEAAGERDCWAGWGH